MITSTECERKAACPNPSLLLQPVLGTDKRNPVFTVSRAEPAAAAALHVYYGAELLEVVPEDRRHPAVNYLDLRERFAALLPRFRQEVGLPAEAVVTCVIDRGIFSHEVFAHAIEAPDYHLITWEKNYRRGQWDPQKRSGQCVLERTRNHAQDPRVYRFEYLDQPWARNPQMRQLIVWATNPQHRTVEVAILTDDRQRPAPEIVGLMFNRWTQENDFKYCGVPRFFRELFPFGFRMNREGVAGC